MHKIKKNRGFTLLEILVAIAIFATLSIMTTQGLRTILSHENQLELSQSNFIQLQNGLELFSRDYEQLILRKVKDNKGNLLPSCQGTRHSICFTHGGNIFKYKKSSSLIRSCYFVEDHIFWKENWAVLDETSKSKRSKHKLLDHVKDVDFEYFSRPQESSFSWPPKVSEDRIPYALRANFHLENEGDISQLYFVLSKLYEN